MFFWRTSTDFHCQNKQWLRIFHLSTEIFDSHWKWTDRFTSSSFMISTQMGLWLHIAWMETAIKNLILNGKKGFETELTSKHFHAFHLFSLNFKGKVFMSFGEGQPLAAQGYLDASDFSLPYHPVLFPTALMTISCNWNSSHSDGDSRFYGDGAETTLIISPKTLDLQGLWLCVIKFWAKI